MPNSLKKAPIKVLVLTLPQSEDRQTRIEAALTNAGIDFEFFWGVDGRTDRDPVFAMYDKPKRVWLKGQPMSQGQLGCFASHYNIWKRCVEEGANYVVLEDDVLFDAPLLKQFLEDALGFPRRLECLRLFKNKTRNHKTTNLGSTGRFDILRYTKGPMSTMGYYITPAAAEKFLVASNPIFLSVDIYMDRYWVNGVQCLGVQPAIVTHDYGFESIIGYGEKVGRRPLFVRLIREAFTLTERLRRFYYNLRVGNVAIEKKILGDD